MNASPLSDSELSMMRRKSFREFYFRRRQMWRIERRSWEEGLGRLVLNYKRLSENNNLLDKFEGVYGILVATQMQKFNDPNI